MYCYQQKCYNPPPPPLHTNEFIRYPFLYPHLKPTIISRDDSSASIMLHTAQMEMLKPADLGKDKQS